MQEEKTTSFAPIFIFLLSAISAVIYTAAFLFMNLPLRYIFALLPLLFSFALFFSVLMSNGDKKKTAIIKASVSAVLFAAVCLALPVVISNYVIIAGSAICAAVQAVLMLIFIIVPMGRFIKANRGKCTKAVISTLRLSAALCFVSAFILCAAATLYVYIVPPVFSASAHLGESVNMIAHRGFSAKAPENTEESAVEAGKEGYYGCEFDIRLSADKVLVVMHDYDVDRMTDGTGAVDSLTYEQLSKLKIDSGHNFEGYAYDVRIPLFEDMLDVCEEYGMIPIIEVKGGGNEAVDALLETLERRDITENCVVIDFIEDELIYLRSKNKDIKLMLLSNEINDRVIEVCSEYDFSLNFNAGLMSVSAVKAARDKGIELAAWTIGNRESLAALNRNGVTFFTTNNITP